jgi:hypothetical protein
LRPATHPGNAGLARFDALFRERVYRKVEGPGVLTAAASTHMSAKRVAGTELGQNVSFAIRAGIWAAPSISKKIARGARNYPDS